MKQYILTVLTAFTLYTGTAHAHLGWTLSNCVNHWGPYYTGRNAAGLPFYMFKHDGYSISVFMLNGRVGSIYYICSDGTSLSQIAETLLRNNIEGNWELYDDGQGKAAIKTWRLLAENGSMVCYAILMQTDSGYFRLQISTAAWNGFLANHNNNIAQDL